MTEAVTSDIRTRLGWGKEGVLLLLAWPVTMVAGSWVTIHIHPTAGFAPFLLWIALFAQWFKSSNRGVDA